MADLTVTITEGVNIEGVQRGGQMSITIPDIMDIYDRVITVPTSEVTLYSTHASNVAGDVFDEDFVKYVRITNKDATNFITLKITGDAGDLFYYKLPASRTLILFDHKNAMDTHHPCEGEEEFVKNLGDISSVTAQADSAAVRTEVFIGSKNA